MKEFDEIIKKLEADIEEYKRRNEMLSSEVNKHIKEGIEKDIVVNKEKELKNDLMYVLEQLDGYLNKGWTIDLNFTDIREKYKQDIEEYTNWE